ncbi:MAG: hypothetical protein GPOALKHO_000543 [Sodalis sp.]|nr:MAG: hypothetical protein GPOALKHO_000543 [Sodalis sp.]
MQVVGYEFNRPLTPTMLYVTPCKITKLPFRQRRIVADLHSQQQYCQIKRFHLRSDSTYEAIPPTISHCNRPDGKLSGRASILTKRKPSLEVHIATIY